MPLNAFIVRPFGEKTVTNLKEVQRPYGMVEVVEKVKIDFDRVHRELIQPALDNLRIKGNTTAMVVSAGNIREDMFHLLLSADLVIADVTIHNPNVFYELGIRHAFQEKYTFLLRSEVSTYPFDLQTDRYFSYNHEKLAEGVKGLTEALRATLASVRADSPVFRLLPHLHSEDRTRFISVPSDFLEEVDRARLCKRGGDLRLLAVEAEGFLWEVEGLRLIGRAQFELNYVGGARVTWEAIVSRYPNDVEANTLLSTIYQGLNDPTRSDQSLARIKQLGALDVNVASEVRGLNARNLKSRWVADWKKETPEKRQQRALRSPLLRKAYEEYEAAFRANLNHCYAGLNALSLLMIEVMLAEKYPDLWAIMEAQTNEYERQRMLFSRKARIEKLRNVLAFSMDSERQRLDASGSNDFWFEILEANYLCLTEANPKRVEQAYLEAAIWAPSYAEESMIRTLELHEELGLTRYDKVDINANTEIGIVTLRKEKGKGKESGSILLFAGLRMETERWKARRNSKNTQVDQLEQPEPGTEEKAVICYLPYDREDDARDKIKRKITEEINGVKNRDDKPGADSKGEKKPLFGMAGGACGGDLLFHRVCDELGIDTRLYLALPKDQYVGEYVAPAGTKWVERFHQVYRKREKQEAARKKMPDAQLAERREMDADVEKVINVLSDTKELPRWLQGKANYNLERRCHIWMLQHALVQRHIHERDGQQVDITLIVLWDGSRKEGIGGIAELIQLAEKHGIKVVKIDCREWMDDKPTANNRLRGEAAKPSGANSRNGEVPAAASVVAEVTEKKG